MWFSFRLTSFLTLNYRCPLHMVELLLLFEMASAAKIPIFVLFLLSLQQSALSAFQFPCFFIFGDSLIDNGNNNQLITKVKVDYRPYGIDFPQGPTGRFTNGKNTVDILAKFLGFDTYIPPFATAQGEDILKGVNYGSGSAGIRSETGQQLGDRISLSRQLLNHYLTVSQITNLLGNDFSAKKHLGKCLYYFVIGSNDYLNNYNIPEYYPTSSQYTPDEYATVLIQQYSQQLKTLYSYGARKISVSGLGPLGCIPASLARGSNGTACVDRVNDAVDLFNEKLKILVKDLNKNLTDAQFIFINAISMMPAELFALVSNTTGQCIPGETPCLIRALHAFYDNFHPTEIVNKVAATVAYLEIQKLILR
ncbi:hypothetical protein BUALT_Bualt10G0018900 [Buddleja alternifolia]|uniref:Uncharacterized protein n=1 Tax=Buddleja alternifolia TaxID=168488 RepID=A0AAV6WWT5_9LAMI|nr:hypothetical protein BUALT_Bualt10G0018900 [Buddleja alternifolia]